MNYQQSQSRKVAIPIWSVDVLKVFVAMEALKEAIKTGPLPIRDSLILATLDSIKAGIKLDDLEKAKQAEALHLTAAKKSRKSRKERKTKFILKQENEEPEVTEPQQRTYRAHEDRRFALMVVRDQHRQVGKDKTERMLFTEAQPLDYSFCFLNTVEEIVTELESPQTLRSKQPQKTRDDRYITSSLRLSYNVLHNFEGFVNILYKIFETGPFGLCWLDLSFNSIDSIDEDTLTQLQNLCILYLHGNQIEDMMEVQKLKVLPSLHTLTLHGNLIEQEDRYRLTVVYYMPYLKHLDFIGVTKGDKAMAAEFGLASQNHWENKHAELVAKAKEQQESANISLTERYMQSAEAKFFSEPAF